MKATLLALVRKRCDKRQSSALVVTHDLNLASQFVDRILLMKDGKAVRLGTPPEVLTPELLHEVFGVEVLVDAHPVTGAPRVTPLVVPRSGETP